jgi:hypothetical protein
LLFTLFAALCCPGTALEQANAATNISANLTRTLIKEPKYDSMPKYAMILLGNSREVQLWMVEDGQRLFVDKNTNGDLTDDGPPLQPSNVRNLDAKRRDFGYELDTITSTDGSRHTGFDLRRWNYGEPEDGYGLLLSVDGKLPMYAGWFGTFWSTNRETAPVIYFGGPFTPKLLRRKDFTIGAERDRLSLCFMHPGSAAGADSRLSIDALPRYIVPTLNIEWPTASGKPLRTSHLLSERCCYWEFYTSEFDMPKDIVPGTAKITVEFPAGIAPIKLTTTEIIAPIVAGSR